MLRAVYAVLCHGTALYVRRSVRSGSPCLSFFVVSVVLVTNFGTVIEPGLVRSGIIVEMTLALQLFFSFFLPHPFFSSDLLSELAVVINLLYWISPPFFYFLPRLDCGFVT